MKKNQQELLQRSIFKIRLYRIGKGISQTEFSELIGISNRKYQRIEAFESVPDLELLYRISEVLEVNFDHLFSPNLQQTELNEVEFFKGPKNFFDEPVVKKSGLEILFSQKFEKAILKMNHPKEILEVKEFTSFSFPLAFNDYTSNCFNQKAVDDFQLKSDISEFPIAWYNVKTMIMLWDMIYTDILKYGYFKYKISHIGEHNTFQGQKSAYCRGFSNHQGKIFVFALIA